MIDIKRFCFDMGLSQAAFAEKIGVDQSVVSHMTRGTRKLRLDHVEKLESIYGKEVVDTYIINDEVADIFTRPQAKQITGEVISAEVIEEAKAEAIEEYKAEESVVIVPVEIANAPQKDIKEYIKSKGDELERITPSDLVKPAEGAERVRKNSMSPTFNPSDIVFFAPLDDVRNITDGNIYYFKIKNRPTMLRRVKIEGEKLRLIAENPNFGDMIITFSDIINVADIVGMFRSSFSNQYAEIEAVRRKKDSQIDKLIKQNGEALKSIGELISVIKNK